MVIITTQIVMYPLSVTKTTLHIMKMIRKEKITNIPKIVVFI